MEDIPSSSLSRETCASPLCVVTAFSSLLVTLPGRLLEGEIRKKTLEREPTDKSHMTTFKHKRWTRNNSWHTT